MFSNLRSAAALIATVAVVTFGGSAAATVMITGAQIKDDSVTGKDLKDSTLTDLQINQLTLTNSDLDKKTKLTPVPGRPGPQGPPGLRGHMGNPGILGVFHYSTAPEVAGKGKVRTLLVSCDPGERALGGGVRTNQAPGLVVVQSAPATGEKGWSVTVRNDGDDSALVSAWVACTRHLG